MQAQVAALQAQLTEHIAQFQVIALKSKVNLVGESKMVVSAMDGSLAIPGLSPSSQSVERPSVEGIVPAMDTAEKDARIARSQANAAASVTAPAVGDKRKGKGSNLDPF